MVCGGTRHVWEAISIGSELASAMRNRGSVTRRVSRPPEGAVWYDCRMGRQNDCPCGSKLPYRACCAPYHRGEAEAPDASALMRSRFSAFALKDAEYLWKTLHPGHADRARPKEEVIKSIKRSAAGLKYMRLSVLDNNGPDEEGTARVLFVAEVFEKGRDLSFMELSRFQRDEEGWRYLDGQLAPAAGLKVEGMSIEAFERALSRGRPKA